ncbi:MAG: hypothetical protein NXI14_02055 [bacterium]|nr:hypothetical protein [bacterium]
MIDASGGATVNLDATVADGMPRFAPSKQRLEELRKDRAMRKIMRDLYDGLWAKVLILDGRTQHFFQDARKGSNKHPQDIGPLVQKFNVFKVACKVHADVNAHRPPIVTVDDEEYPLQALALKSISDRCLFDTLYHRANRRAAKEGSAIIHACIDADQLSANRGAVLALVDNDEWLPVGPIGPDGQPRVWERRWIIARTIDRREQLYLRIERYWSPNGQVVIDNEAYKVKAADTLVDTTDTSKCVRVSLAEALGEEVASEIEEIRQLPTRFIPVVWLLRDMSEADQPEGLIGENDIDLLDEVMGAFSQWARSRSVHATPKMRVGRGHVDPKTNQANVSNDVFIDPEKEIEYILAQFELSKILESLDRAISYALAQMEVSQMLLGLEPAGGVAETHESRRLKAMSTLTSAHRSVPMQGPALGRAFECACALESSIQTGWPYGTVDVEPRPEIPKETIDRVREEREKLEGGLTSVRRALGQIHGEDLVEEILEEIREDQKRQTELQRQSIFGATGSNDPFGDTRADTQAPQSAGTEVDAEGDAVDADGEVRIV